MFSTTYIALCYILPPCMLLILSARYEDDFIWSSYGFAFIVQGVFVGKVLPGLGKRWGHSHYSSIGVRTIQYIRYVGILIFGLLVLTHAFFNIRYDLGLGRVSLDDQILFKKRRIFGLFAALAFMTPLLIMIILVINDFS